MGYPNDILATRAVVKHGNYAVIPPNGLVNNVVPGIEGCRVSIVASPKMGAGFVQYVLTIPQGCGTTRVFGGQDNVETFLYVIEGEAVLTAGGQEYSAPAGAYLYAPAGMGLTFTGRADTTRALLYKQAFLPLPGVKKPEAFFGNVNDMPWKCYDNMDNVRIKDLLPTDVSMDMNMHILSFLPGGCHPFVETHVQEHGMYILEGEGCYLLDNEWMMIRPEDYIWMGAFVSQAAYGVGQVPFTYVYSKDCNRDVEI